MRLDFFYKLFPDRGIEEKGEPCHKENKASKDLVFFCTNPDGTEKSVSLVIGKYKKKTKFSACAEIQESRG
jgi:hypothetical protein